MKLTVEYIHDNYYFYLLKHAYKYSKSTDDAKDIVQLTLIKIWQKLDLYDSEKASLATWLYKILRNTALDKIRQHKNHLSNDEVDWDYFIEPSIDVNSIDLKKNLNKVRLKYRLYLHLFYLEGHTHPQIAKRTDTSLGTVKSRIRKGLEELKKIYL